MRLSTLLPLLGLLALGYAEKCPRQRTSPGKEILCYTSSNDPEELADVICKCTTLVHQGHELHNLTTAGIEELQKVLKESNPVLQFVISVTDPQRSLRTSATTRQEASGRLANIMSQVDGVELDMTAGSKERLTHFVKGLKDEMTRKSNEKRILLALPTKPEELAKQYDIKALAKYVDLFTMSTNYLFDETESSNTFHPSRLMGIFDMLNTDSLVDLVSGLGVPKKKLLISVPASAYKFTLKTKDKTIPGSPTEEKEPTVISQKELCDLMSAGEWTVERDTDLTAPYAFKDSTWIAFEDKTSVGIKGKYVLLRELAGLGIHDVENDQKNNCGKPVTYEVYHSFTDMKRKTRGAVLASLENDIHHMEIPTSRHVKSSGYRIVRVVDTAGAIHAIRENTQTEFICTRQGYFVHPKSCNRFYRCVKFDQGVDDFSVFEFDCPAGLAFDERTEVCVWPGSLTEGSPCPGSSEIAPVPRARFQCPERDGYYADPQNCRWFFACFDLGEPEPMAYEFRCPFGLVFDEQKLICEWPWLVPGCGSSGYSRTEYGGGEYGIRQQGHGAGYGQGSGNGGAGYGDYSGTGIGGAGQYGSEFDGSLYKGSKPSESRYSETGSGQYDGANRGLKYPGDGGYRGQGYSGQGADGSGYSGLGSGYSGAEGAGGEGGIGGVGGVGGVGGPGGRGGTGGKGGVGGVGGAGGDGNDGGSGAGSKYFGAGGAGYGYSGAGNAGGAGSRYSGAGGVGSQYSGAGSTGGAGSRYSGGAGLRSQYAGAAGSGSEYSGAGGAGSQYSGAGGASQYFGVGGEGSGVYGAGGAGSKYSSSGANSGYSGTGGAGLGHSGAEGVRSGYSGEDGAGSKYSGAGSTGAGYSGVAGSEDSRAGSKYSGAGDIGSKYTGIGAGGYSGSGGKYSGAGGAGSSYSGVGGIGSKYSGAGGAGSVYSGAGEAGSGHAVAGGVEFGSKYSGAVYGHSETEDAGSEYSGTGGKGSQYSGVGSTGSRYSGTGNVGSEYSGAEGIGSQYSGAGSTGSAYSGVGSTGSKYSGSGSAGSIHSGSDGSAYSGSVGDGSKYTGANSGSSTFGTDVSGQGGYTGSTYTGYAGSGSTSSSDSGITSGSGYSGADSSGSGYSGAGGFGTKYSGSTGSGSVHGVYPGEDVSTVTYGGSRKPGVVIQPVPIGQRPGSSIYQTGTTGSGYVSTVGHTASIAGNSGYNGFSSSTKYGGSGKDGLSVSVQTAGSGYGSSSGAAGDYSGGHGSSSGSDEQDVVNGGISSGSVFLTKTSGSGASEYAGQQNVGYSSSGQSDFDAQDVVNGGHNSGSIVVSGATGSGAGGYTGQGINSGSVVVTGSTGSGYTSRPITGNAFTSVSSSGSGYSTPLTTLNPAYSVFGTRKPVTPAQEIFLQTVTPGYSVTGSGVKSSVTYGSSSGSEGAGGIVTGSGYTGGVTGSGNFLVNEANTEYHGVGYEDGHVTGISGGGSSNHGGSGYVDTGSSSTVSQVGKGGIFTGTTTYHGKGGSSSSHLSTKTSNTNGNGIQGGFVTSDVHAGTILSHDGSSGTVISGNEDEGSAYVGSSTPGYVETNSVTPGYVINGVTKTLYGQSTPGTFITGTAAPGVVYQGNSGPNSYVDGQIYKGASVRGSTVNGAGIRGSTTYYGNTGASAGSKGGAFSVNGGVSSIQDSGYKTNEYHDNGGRGSVTYNNGYTTTKFTEKELQDRYPTYASLPDTIVSGGRIEGSSGVVLGNTIAGFDGHTSQQFTKTGPTKTGITTAQIGGTGSYVTNTGYRRPTPSPTHQNIGSQAFATGQGSSKGYSNSGGSIGSDVNGLAYVTSTVAPDVSHIDTSKINLGPASTGGSSGYRYTKPSVQFVTGSVTSSTPTPFSVTYQEPVAPLTVTTPASPHLNVEVYNTPSVVTSAPITAAPAVVNTYSYRRPSNGYKQPSYQTTGSSTGSPASGGYKYRRPTQSPVYQGSGEGDQQLFTVSSTPAPIAFATRPADVYKTTLFEAAKLPAAVSSLAPVFDNGYKTVVSSTAAPVAVTTGQYFYKDSRFETNSAVSGLTSDKFDIDNQQPGTVYQKIPFGSTPTPNTDDGYTYEKPTNQLSYNYPSTVTPSVTIHQRPKYNIGGQQVKYATVSTPAPDFDGSYQRPSIPARPAAKRPTYQKEFGSVSTSFSSAGAQGYQYSKPAVKFVSSTASPDYTGSRGGSPTNLDIPQDEVKKLIGNYERGSVKYTSNSYGDESIGSIDNSGAFGYKDFGKRPSVTPTVFVSSTASPSYEPTTPDSNIRSNAYGRYSSSSVSSSSGYRGAGYYSPQAPSYEISTVQTPTKEGKGKVIVKLSDLHPLLLGKLGAQCTCRSDPFETLRGPGAKSILIKSNKGKIDLSKYDESDVYVDLEADREPGQSVGYYRSPTPGPSASSLRTPATAIFGVTTPAPPQVFRSRGKPSTAYLPAVSTPSTIGGSSGPVIVVPDDGGLGSPSDIADTQFVAAPEGFIKEGAPVGRTAGVRRKSGRTSGSAGATGNAIGGAGAAFDRYGPGGWRNDDETLQGGSDCARAGLFRHPKYCNKFYACHYDEWKQKFTLHVFNCPVHLSFDSTAGACNWPTTGPACQDDNLLV